MTREQLLRYAQKAGGMFGQEMTKVTDAHFTLDRTYWTGNTYCFVYHVQDGSFYYKQVMKLPIIVSMCDSAMSIAYETDPTAIPLPAFNMMRKLHQLTQKD